MELATLSPRDLVLWFKEMKLARGTAYLMTKGHRISGILLSFYLLAHIYTLSGLANPEHFQAEMEMLKHPFFMFLEWCLVIPLAFHAFNGGRLILFEMFHKREDSVLIRWALVLSLLFILFMAVLMSWGTQQVSTFLFWSFIVIVAGIVVCFVWQSVWPTFNKTQWKMQRVTGALLISLALGHYVFMHLNGTVGHDAKIVLDRMSHPLIVLIDFVLLSAATLHAWYGIKTITYDIVSTRRIRQASMILLSIITVIVYIAGLRILTLGL